MDGLAAADRDRRRVTAGRGGDRSAGRFQGCPGDIVMADPVLILIHGIGDHPPGWSEAAIAKLDEKAADYETMDGATIADLFTVVEIAYDEIFTDVATRWAEEVQTLKSTALYGHVEPALDWLDGSARGDFVWTHMADVVLYMSSAVRNAVASEVAALIGETIAELGTTNLSYNILAHSMGSSVAAEAVTALGSTDPNPEGWQGLPEGFRFDNVFMLANTSRLLQRESIKAYTTSRLLPVNLKPDGLCVNYWNISHQYDPVPAPRRFELTSTPTESYIDVKLEHFYDTNVHALTHYLEHPLVHGAIFRLAGAGKVRRDTWRNAIQRYEDKAAAKFGGQFTKFTEVRSYLDRLESHEPPNLVTAVDFLDQIVWITRRLREML
jgi:pimeloyl-ACP methyl ester carboxylesterase